VIDPGPDLDGISRRCWRRWTASGQPHPGHPPPQRPLPLARPLRRRPARRSPAAARRIAHSVTGPAGRGRRGRGLPAPGCRDRRRRDLRRSGLDPAGLTTPGHTSNHVCFALAEENALFSGDHVMGWSTTVITPPDGDMGDYFASLREGAGRGFDTLWPTHGSPVRDVPPRSSRPMPTTAWRARPRCWRPWRRGRPRSRPWSPRSTPPSIPVCTRPPPCRCWRTCEGVLLLVKEGSG
jgi:glyoxylase-like metal-dependent hydrolase (beta-lactamase superfamily II)